MNDKSKISGWVKIELFDSNGKLKELREGPNLITTAGKAHVADRMSDLGEARIDTSTGYMGVGTSSQAAVVGDTDLIASTDRNQLTSVTQSTNTVIYIGDWAAGDATATLQEAGIFNAVSGGTMLARQVFSAIAKAAGDTLKITWTITFA